MRQRGRSSQMLSALLEQELSPNIPPCPSRTPTRRPTRPAIRRPCSPYTWMHNREPRTNAPYFDRLVCYLLNKLQEPLQPKPGQSKDFFRVETPLPKFLCCHVGSVIADAAVRVGLDAHTYVKHIDVDITAHKRRSLSGDIIYTLKAKVSCFNWDGEEVEIFEDNPVQHMEASVTAEWMNDDSRSRSTGDEGGNMWDRLTFGRALLLLRRAAKKKFNRFGQLRTVKEAEDSPVLAGSLTLWGLMPGQVEVPSADRDIVMVEACELDS